MTDENLHGNEPENAENSVSITFYDDPSKIDEEGWKAELTKLEDFDGNIENAAEMLKRIADGIALTKTMLNEEGEENYIPPGLAIAEGERAKRMSALHVHDQVDAVVISKYFLANLSNLDFSRIGSLEKANGEVFFEGYAKDFGFLLGVEEAHHSFYDQKFGSTSEYVSGSNMPTVQYDAIEHEYQALLYQGKASKRAGLPQETVDFLQQRIDNATNYRLSSTQ